METPAQLIPRDGSQEANTFPKKEVRNFSQEQVHSLPAAGINTFLLLSEEQVAYLIPLIIRDHPVQTDWIL